MCNKIVAEAIPETIKSMPGTNDHHFHDLDDEGYTRPDPYKLKDLGNKEFEAGQYASAIDIWKLALKEALKASVREPSKKLFDLQMQLRMNLALGFMKEEDLVMAKEHMMVVFENKHDTPKVFYRFAEVYLGLQDYDKALSMASAGLKQFPEDKALHLIALKIRKETRDYEKQVREAIKKKVTLDLGDHRSNLQTNYLKKIDMDKYKDLFDSSIASDEKINSLWDDATRELIQWRYKAASVPPGEVQSDLDDRQSLYWTTCWTSKRLAHDRMALHATQSLSVLAALEAVLRQSETCSPDNVSQRKAIQYQSKQVFLPPFPIAGYGSSLKKITLKRNILDWLTRNSDDLRDNYYRPFTIHCIGARSDMEMETKWLLLSERCPYMESVQVIMIGFRDSDDTYSRKLSGGEYLSPPLSKRNGWRPSQKLIARLYKGDYLQFLRSKAVTAATDTSMLSDMDLGREGSKQYMLPALLSHHMHPFHPDLILIPEPNLSLHFQDWIPSLCTLLLASVPILFLGYSVLAEHASHEAVVLPQVLTRLGATFVLPPVWNPFSVPIDPGADVPPMLLFQSDGTSVEYSGPSGKYAVMMMVQGLDHISEEVIKLASGEGVLSLQEELRKSNIDVFREFEFQQSREAQESSKQLEVIKETLIEEQAHQIKELLDQHCEEVQK